MPEESDLSLSEKNLYLNRITYCSIRIEKKSKNADKQGHNEMRKNRKTKNGIILKYSPISQHASKTIKRASLPVRKELFCALYY